MGHNGHGDYSTVAIDIGGQESISNIRHLYDRRGGRIFTFQRTITACRRNDELDCRPIQGRPRGHPSPDTRDLFIDRRSGIDIAEQTHSRKQIVKRPNG